MLDLDELEAAVNDTIADGPTIEEQIQASGEQLEKLLRRVRAALTIAENAGATEDERSAASEKAAALMAKYGITAAMLADQGVAVEDVLDWLVEIGSPYTYDKATLLAVLVAEYGGQVVYTSKSPQHSELKVYAMSSNVARMKILWPSLLKQMQVEMNWAAAQKPVGVRRDVFDRSFIAGFAKVIGDRLRVAERRAQADAQAERDRLTPGATSVELVLAGRRNQVELAFRKAHPRTQTATRKITASTAGMTAGRAAGGRADLGHRRIG